MPTIPFADLTSSFRDLCKDSYKKTGQFYGVRYFAYFYKKKKFSVV